MAAEQADYVVALHHGPFEVRDYPAHVIAEVTVTGERDAAVDSGLRLLAGYMSGGNALKQLIVMTTPVTQARERGDPIAVAWPVTSAANTGAWQVRFAMPKRRKLASLPTPDDPRVRLLAVPPARYAVVRFSGLARGRDVEQQSASLEAFTTSHRLRPVGPSSLARFNARWIPWFLRRNEIRRPLLVSIAS